MILLDTNVVSELRKAGDDRADPNVLTWIIGRDATEFHISCLTLMEIEIGILRVQRRDPAQATRLRAWLEDRVVPEFADRTLPVDAKIARTCARLHVPDPRSDRDALIAATALVHGMTVATRNTADFEGSGVALVNPWTG
ncbi:MAG: type II toxin-antitoxin system VapC family toxin [Pseudomonadota bacterium]